MPVAKYHPLPCVHPPPPPPPASLASRFSLYLSSQVPQDPRRVSLANGVSQGAAGAAAEASTWRRGAHGIVGRGGGARDRGWAWGDGGSTRGGLSRRRGGRGRGGDTGGRWGCRGRGGGRRGVGPREDSGRSWLPIRELLFPDAVDQQYELLFPDAVDQQGQVRYKTLF